MMKHATVLLLPLLAAPGLAQDIDADEEQPELRRYTVEMIIFRYAENIATGSELFVPDLPPAKELLPEDHEIEEITLAIRDSEIDALLAQVYRADGDNKYELVMLAEEEFTLLETYEHLQRLDAYEPLLHFGWTQPTYPDKDVESRPLSFFITPPDGLEGDLRLYLSRYLHLAVRLQLDAPVEDAALADEFASRFTDSLGRRSFNDGFFDFGDGEAVSYPVRYRIEEDRIFRNGELRYFDHPKFGVLAKITRQEEPAELDPENLNPDENELFEDFELLGD